MDKSTKENERKFILECIDVYRELPCLWKITSADYSNRSKKEAAYSTLLSKYQERYENATKEDVKRKFNSLRTNFRKELKKISQSEKSGAGTDDVYETSLWYYDAMIFLQDQEMPESSRTSLSNASEVAVQDNVNELVSVFMQHINDVIIYNHKQRVILCISTLEKFTVVVSITNHNSYLDVIHLPRNHTPGAKIVFKHFSCYFGSHSGISLVGSKQSG